MFVQDLVQVVCLVELPGVEPESGLVPRAAFGRPSKPFVSP